MNISKNSDQASGDIDGNAPFLHHQGLRQYLNVEKVEDENNNPATHAQLHPPTITRLVELIIGLQGNVQGLVKECKDLRGENQDLRNQLQEATEALRAQLQILQARMEHLENL